jgi:hypothetical protein
MSKDTLNQVASFLIWRWPSSAQPAFGKRRRIAERRLHRWRAACSVRHASVANKASKLFFETPTIEVADAHRPPAEFSHQPCNTTMRGGGTLTVRNFQNIERSAGDTLHIVKPYRPMRALQAQAPRPGELRRNTSRRGEGSTFAPCYNSATRRSSSLLKGGKVPIGKFSADSV